MHLYDSKVDTFIPKATSGQIADVLRTRFIARLDQNPSESEIRSWRHSLGAFAEAISDAAIDDAWIILEYQLPLCSSRVEGNLYLLPRCSNAAVFRANGARITTVNRSLPMVLP